MLDRVNRFRMRRWLRRGGWYGAAGVILVATIIVIWPVFKGGDLAGVFYRETRGFMLVALIWAFLIPFILAAILMGLVLVTGSIARKLSWRRLERFSQRAVRILAPAELALIVIAAVGVVLAAAVRFLSAPATVPARFVQISMIDVKVSPFIRNLGPYTLQRANAKLSGPYLALDHNVISLTNFPPVMVFPQPIETVSDIHLRRGILLVVTGQNLVQVHDDGQVGIVARLPMPGMRIGLRAIPNGVSTSVLIAGNQDGKGSVFEIGGQSTYSKLLSIDEPVVGAAGCLDLTAAALSDRVVVVRPGFRPRVLMQLPKNSGPIISILARLEKGVFIYPGGSPVRQSGKGQEEVLGDVTDSCLWVVATRNGVYGHQSGMTALMIAGLGGNLSADESQGLDFALTDNSRETAVLVSFKPEAANQAISFGVFEVVDCAATGAKTMVLERGKSTQEYCLISRPIVDQADLKDASRATDVVRQQPYLLLILTDEGTALMRRATQHIMSEPPSAGCPRCLGVVVDGKLLEITRLNQVVERAVIVEGLTQEEIDKIVESIMRGRKTGGG